MKKFSYLIIIANSLLFSMSNSFAEKNSKEGKMFVNLSLLTSKYAFDVNDVINELPIDFSNRLAEVINNNQDDEDRLNTSIAIGYYYSEHLSLRMNYVDDVEVATSEFCIFFCPAARNEFNGDMSILEFDAKYRFAEVHQDVSLYLLAGAAYHRINAKVIDDSLSVGDENRLVLKKNITELNSKVGVGIQWDFLEDFGANLGYTKYSFASMDKFYLELEYRW